MNVSKYLECFCFNLVFLARLDQLCATTVLKRQGNAMGKSPEVLAAVIYNLSKHYASIN